MKESLTADSYIGLLKKLRMTDISVSRISEGRTKEQTERWTMYRFRSTLGDREFVDYPLGVHHVDRPDFRLEMPTRTVGAEVTSAMPEEWARALVLLEKLFPGGTIEPDCFRWGGPKRSTKEILGIIKESQKRLTGMGWVGDSVEREWAGAIWGAFQNKTQLLNSRGFKRFDWNWLLVYDNVPQVALDLEVAFKHLLPILKTVSDSLPPSMCRFNALFVETDKQFITIENNKWGLTKIRDVWSKRGG